MLKEKINFREIQRNTKVKNEKESGYMSWFEDETFVNDS